MHGSIDHTLIRLFLVTDLLTGGHHICKHLLIVFNFTDLIKNHKSNRLNINPLKRCYGYWSINCSLSISRRMRIGGDGGQCELRVNQIWGPRWGS